MHHIDFNIGMANNFYSRRNYLYLKNGFFKILSKMQGAVLNFSESEEMIKGDDGYVDTCVLRIGYETEMDFLNLIDSFFHYLLEKYKNGEIVVVCCDVNNNKTQALYDAFLKRVMQSNDAVHMSRLLLKPIPQTTTLCLRIEKNWRELHKHIVLAERKRIHGIYKECLERLINNLDNAYAVTEMCIEEGEIFLPSWMPHVGYHEALSWLMDDTLDPEVKYTFLLISPPPAYEASFDDILVDANGYINVFGQELFRELKFLKQEDLYKFDVVNFVYYNPNQFMQVETDLSNHIFQ